MHHAFVVRAGPDVVGLCVIAVGVCWTVGRPEGGRGCVWAGLWPRLGPGSLELCSNTGQVVAELKVVTSNKLCEPIL